MIETRLRILTWIPEEAPASPTQALERPRRPISGRWFGAALAAQLLVLAFLPAGKYAAAASPTVVHLRAAPVDPVDLLRGRYVAVTYAIEEGRAPWSLPGWARLQPKPGTTVYLTLAPEAGPTRQDAPRPWAPVAVAAASPEHLPPGRVALRATATADGVDLGLREYFVPDAQGERLQLAFARAGDRSLVALRVDRAGRGMIESLHL